MPDMTTLATSGWQLSECLKKRSKMPPQTALGGISRERFKRGSRNLTRLSRTTAPINLPQMTSLAVFGRLKNAIKYCTKVRKTGVAGVEAHNSVTVSGKITCNDTEFDWTSAEIVKLSGAAFCLASPIGGLLNFQSHQWCFCLLFALMFYVMLNVKIVHLFLLHPVVIL